MITLRRILSAAAGLAAAGCVEFNAECTPPVAEPDAVVGWLDVAVPVSRGSVRTQENALASAIADSYVRAFEATAAPVDIALENAGAIRAEGLCTTRTELPKGPLERRVLRDTLPFSNELVVVELDAAALLGVLEHGVATLGTAAPSGQFLHASGFSYEVDCAEPPEQLRSGPDGLTREFAGSRVRSVTVGATVLRRDAPLPDTRFRVALNEFLASGGDGFLDLAGRAVTRTERLTYTVFEDDLGRRSGPEAPARLVVDPDSPRVVRRNCE